LLYHVICFKKTTSSFICYDPDLQQIFSLLVSILIVKYLFNMIQALAT